MLITVHCPSCQSRYQLDPNLRGKQMRCPNARCREIFTVRADDEPEAAPPPNVADPQGPGSREAPSPGSSRTGSGRVDGSAANVQRTGSVGDMVPILPAASADDGGPEASSDEDHGAAAVSSAHVEDVLPLLPAEPVSRQQPEPPQEARSWQEPPPVRDVQAPPYKSEKPATKTPRRPTPAKTPPQEQPEPIQPAKHRTDRDTMRAIPDPADPTGPPALEAPGNSSQATVPGPVELGPGAWAPPPVRRPGEEPSSEPAAHKTSHEESYLSGVAADTHDAEAGPAVATRRWAPRLIAAMLALLVVTGGVAWLILSRPPDEGKLWQSIVTDIDQGKVLDAAKSIKKLREAFPESPKKGLYKLYADLIDVRILDSDISPDLSAAADKMEALLKDHEDDPILTESEHTDRVWKTCRQLIDQFIEAARATPPVSPESRTRARQLLGQARQLLDDAKKRIKRKLPDDQLLALEAKMQGVEVAIARAEEVEHVLAEVGQYPPKMSNLDKMLTLLKKHHLQDDPRGQALVEDFKGKLIAGVTFTPAQAVKPPRPEAEEPSLLVAPRIVRPVSNMANGDAVMFALARGILYALAQSDGALRWATRVGLDTYTLPTRLPINEVGRETVLVLSSETNTLTARDLHTGELVWSYHLQSPCLGRPVVVGRRVFVATYDGKVHEIETAEGHLLGWYDLGSPLNGSGVHQEGTNLLYFPAESRVVYVLDVSKSPQDPEHQRRGCVAILFSEHPAGSLRGAPIIISRQEVRKMFQLDPAAWPDYLVLNQTDGLKAMQLRVFTLPIPPTAKAAEMPLELRVPGWSWFSPHHDWERLLQVTDAGTFTLVGINQVRDEDKPLFLQYQQELAPGGEGVKPVRAQVVHAAEDDFWVLAHSTLQLLHFDKFSQRLTPMWGQPLAVGSPLHRSQVAADGTRIFAVTQSLTQGNCLASAVAADQGTVRWQRQLGFVCQGDPLLIDGKVLALDRAGALFLFDPGQPMNPLNGSWRTGGQRLASPLPSGASVSSLVLAPDRRSAYAITCVDRGDGREKDRYDLVVRHYPNGKSSSERTFHRWPALLGGTVALQGNNLLVPLADGVVRRQPLDKESGTNGPTWRANHADEGAQGHVVPLGNEDFLVTDGSHNIARWRWPADNNFKMLQSRELPARIATAPLLLPAEKPESELRLLVADADGFVHLLRGEQLTMARSWRLNGKITRGPYVMGQRVGCIVDERRLVCLDPDQPEAVWTYSRPDGDIVGQPQLVGDLLIVADSQGGVLALNPATGQPRGAPGYKIRAQAAPAAAPVAFGADGLFVPLTDGTVLLLPLTEISPKAEARNPK